MCILSKRANNVKIEKDRVTYETSGYLEGVEMSNIKSYIHFSNGEIYYLHISEAQKAANRMGKKITIQVNVYNSGEIIVKFLGYYCTDPDDTHCLSVC